MKYHKLVKTVTKLDWYQDKGIFVKKISGNDFVSL